MFAFELDQAAATELSPARRADEGPVEDDYSEESFPADDPDGDLAWRCQDAVAASQMLRETRKWAKRPYRESECVVPSA